MLGSCILVSLIPPPTNLISPHVVCDLHVSADQIPQNLLPLVVDSLPLISIPKMVLHLFRNFVSTFSDKSFSYSGFEVGEILLLCIRNTKIITILFIQKLSNHDNQTNKTKI